MASPNAPSTEEDYKIELLPEDYPQYDLSFKLIFIGDSSVGKSCLTAKAVKNNFEEYYSNNLDTKIIIYSYSTSNSNNRYLKATFVYDDVLYIFTGMNMSKDDLINYINGLVF